jgi:hypothetical protein
MRFLIEGLTVIRKDFGERPSDFYAHIQCELTAHTGGGEAFSVNVISPTRLQSDLEGSRDRIELGRGYLFVLDYDENEVKQRLQALVDAANASTWSELRTWISMYFDWV